MDKDLREIVKALVEQGFDAQLSSKGHVIVRRDGRIVATFSGTASDWRSMRNGLAAAKRAGFIWQGKHRKRR
jgi:hypothetical protein